MRRSRLWLYLLLSLCVHALCLWLLRFSPTSRPVARPPVAIRLLETPPAVRSTPSPTTPKQPSPVLPPRPPTPALPLPPPPSPVLPPPPVPPPPPPPAQPVPPPPPKQGGVVVEIPKPPRQERPDKARVLSQYDSKAQDAGEGAPGARKPSGEKPPELPPELPLPERYSRKGPQQELPGAPPPSAAPSPIPLRRPPDVVRPEPKPPDKTVQKPPPSQRPLEAPPVPKSAPLPRKPAPLERPLHEEKRLAEAPEGAVPGPERPPERVPPSTPVPRETPPRVAREKEEKAPRENRLAESRPEPPAVVPKKPVPRDSKQKAEGTPDKTSPAAESQAGERRYAMTAQQEIAMLQNHKPSAEVTNKNTLEEHFARLEQRLPLLSFDVPGKYSKGAERPGEGQGNTGGGKYRSIDSYGIKHFSYLMRLKRKIEMVLSIPQFAANRGKIGTPIVGFTVRRDGELAEAILLRSSGYPEFDQAVVRAIRRAAPYYPFPEHFTDPELSIQVFVTLS